MHRFAKRCSREKEFVAASKRMVKMMVKLGYDPEKIKRKVYKFEEQVPQLYFKNNGGR